VPELNDPFTTGAVIKRPPTAYLLSEAGTVVLTMGPIFEKE
jgi:hypothetical protein